MWPLDVGHTDTLPSTQLNNCINSCCPLSSAQVPDFRRYQSTPQTSFPLPPPKSFTKVHFLFCPLLKSISSGLDPTVSPPTPGLRASAISPQSRLRCQMIYLCQKPLASHSPVGKHPLFIMAWEALRDLPPEIWPHHRPQATRLMCLLQQSCHTGLLLPTHIKPFLSQNLALSTSLAWRTLFAATLWPNATSTKWPSLPATKQDTTSVTIP